MNNVYPVTSTRRKGAARGREDSLPLYETCTTILKTLTSKVALLMYVAIFAVLGQAMAQTCPGSVTLTATGGSTYCSNPATGTAPITLTATTDVPLINGSTVRFFQNTVQISPDITVVTGTGGNTTNGGRSISYTTQAPVNATGTSWGYDVSILNMPPCPNVISASPAFVAVVNGTPNVTNANFTNSGQICSGGTATLTFVVGGPTSGNITINYYNTAIGTGTMYTVTAPAASTGTTTITATTPVLTQNTTYAISSITTTAGCNNSSVTAQTTVAVGSGPVITNITSPQQVCQGGTLQVTGTVPNPTSGTNTFGWYFNGTLIGTTGTTGTQSLPDGFGGTITINFTNPNSPTLTIQNVQPGDQGNYTLQVCNSAYAPCTCSYSNVVTPIVNPLPTATFTTASPVTICYNSATSVSGTYTPAGSSVIITYNIGTGGVAGPSQTVNGTNGTFTIPVPSTLSANTSYTVSITAIQTNGPSGCVQTTLLPSPVTVSVRQTITFGSPITVSNSGQFNCNNSTLTATVPGATTFPSGTTAISYNLTSTSGYNATVSTASTVNPAPGNGVSFSGLTGSTSGITTYTLTAVASPSGCTYSTTFTVGQVPTVVTQTSSATAITCFGTSSTVSGTVAGGTPGASPYYTITLTGLNGAGNYSANVTTLSNGVYSYSLSGVAAGTYNVMATDSHNCPSAPQQLTIVQPSQIQVTATPGVTTLSCANSTTVINVTATGGAAAGTFTYTLLTGSSTVQVLAARPGNVTQTFNNIVSAYPYTTYTVQATDVNGCTVTSAPINIFAPTPVTATLGTVTQPTCVGGYGSIQVSGGGGTAPYRFSLSGTNTTNVITPSPSTATSYTFTNVVPGTYTPTVIDANNCYITLAPVTITAIPAITASVTPSAIQCNGGTSVVTIGNLAGGNGNPVTFSIVGTTQAGLPFSVTTTGNPATANVPAGTYSVTAANSGCSAQPIGSSLSPVGNLVINQPSAIVVTASAVTYSPVCNSTGGNVTLSATGGTGGYTYQLINASNSQVVGTNTNGTFTGLASGTYNYLVTASNGCTAQSNPSIASTQIVVSVPAQLTIGTPTVTTMTCAGGTTTVTITANGGIGARTFTVWLPNGGTQVVTTSGTATFNLAAGSYTVTVTDANGCAATNNNLAFSVSNPPGSTAADLLLTAASPVPGNLFTAVGNQIGVTYTITNLSAPSGIAASGFELDIVRPNLNFTVTLDPAYASSWTQISAPNAGLARFQYVGMLSCGSAATYASIKVNVTEVTAAGKLTFPLSATVNYAPDPYTFNNVHAYNLSTNQ